MKKNLKSVCLKMMAPYLHVLALSSLFTLLAHSAPMEIQKNVITDPLVSSKCKELLESRQEKINIQQRLSSLLNRNQKLLQKVPAEKRTLKNRLESTRVKVRNELYLVSLQVESTEENIIRSGCPGINL